MGSSHLKDYGSVCVVIGWVLFALFWLAVMGVVIGKLLEYLPLIALGGALVWYARSLKKPAKQEDNNEQK